jgi:hypothetical protein
MNASQLDVATHVSSTIFTYPGVQLHLEKPKVVESENPFTTFVNESYVQLVADIQRWFVSSFFNDGHGA